LAATRPQITRGDDDRELQTGQTIVGLPARKLQPPVNRHCGAVTHGDPYGYLVNDSALGRPIELDFV
jgi:hypothetical protein